MCSVEKLRALMNWSRILRKFTRSDRREEMGQNARKYYEENFEEKLFMDKLESKF